MTSRPRFGLLLSHTDGLAGHIGSLAALQHLVRVDDVIDRQLPHDLDRPTHVILTGAPAAGPQGLRFDGANLIPLLLDVTLFGAAPGAEPASPTARDVEALAAHGPVGCRDTATVELLADLGVPAYFSGCLALTFPESTAPRSDRIVLVDAPTELTDRLPAELRRRAVVHQTGSIAHRPRRLAGPAGLSALVAARRLLRRCAGAGLVVTTCFPLALASTALGTPSILLAADPDDPAFGGDTGFVPTVALGEAVDAPGSIDWSLGRSLGAGRASAGRGSHRALAEHLTRTCREFVAAAQPGGVEVATTTTTSAAVAVGEGGGAEVPTHGAAR